MSIRTPLLVEIGVDHNPVAYRSQPNLVLCLQKFDYFAEGRTFRQIEAYG